jgi:hypothetical protein
VVVIDLLIDGAKDLSVCADGMFDSARDIEYGCGNGQLRDGARDAHGVGGGFETSGGVGR